MTQALFTAMTGLNAGTEQLTVVSDNVANMNTTAYKTSRVNFQDIWYQTKTTGTNSTATMGGTNPYQVGVGVKCASITKDFGASSTTTTGNATDMAITGQGWFTALSTDGEVLLTRDGTFALDENGYLCTANGYKVLGMDSLISSTNCDIPIKLPTQIQVIEEGTPESNLKMMNCNELNNIETITAGDFTIVPIKADGSKGTPITVTLSSDVSTSTVSNLLKEIGNAAKGSPAEFSVGLADGSIVFEPGAGYIGLEFEPVIGGSNFLTQTKLDSISMVDGKYASEKLNISATITEVQDFMADTTKMYKSFSVGLDGLITVTYSDGSTLSVSANSNSSTNFVYTNENGVIIKDDINNTNYADNAKATNSLYVDPNVLVKANMQMQLAKVTNDNGLVAIGNNFYSIGVDSGDVVYTAANVNGVGAVVTGALESSNVDLAEQFANMILAQRLVQANSQVFNGANSMLETLVYLGR